MGWIQTYTGRKFFPLAPRNADIDIVDIAHALAHECRFNGHVKTFYSVAEHCVRVSQQVPQEFKLWGLLHDASEAYLKDLPAPVKRAPEFAFYRQAEARLMLAICQWFGLDPHEPMEVKWADQVLLATEARDLMAPRHPEWVSPARPLNGVIMPLHPGAAKELFLNTFATLHRA